MAKFQVTVTNIDKHSKVELVKSLRAISEATIKQADALIAYLARGPTTLVAGVDRTVADHVAELLRRAGVEVTVEESSVNAPLSLNPLVDGRYEWSRLHGRVPVK